jgi:hypothetical protein
MFLSALVALVILPATMMIQAIAIALTVRFVVWLLKVGYAGPTLRHNATVTMGVMVILLAALLLQVAVWAGAFVLCGALPDFGTAFYHSAVNFTTLGYGDIVMTSGWRLLGPLEAANGVLMSGVSASAMFAVISRLIELRLKRQPQNLHR